MNNLIGTANPAPSSPWLSILIPVFNVQAYLKECVDSVMSQVDEEVEVILLDDCSTDGSWELMLQLKEQWRGRITVLQHAKNGGLSAARNTMIDAARGQYLWFLDSDDKLLPEAVAELHAVVHAHAPDVVLCDFQVWRDRPRLKHRLRGEHCRRTFKGKTNALLHDRAHLLTGLLRTGQLHAWSKISRRSLWHGGLRFPEGRYFEDMRTMLLMAARADSFYHVAHSWVAYRQRISSILASMNAKKACDQSAALMNFYDQIDSQGWAGDASFRFALAHQCARNFIGATRYLSRRTDALSGDEVRALALQFRADFEASSPLSARELEQAYLRRGQWIKWSKFHHWFSRQWN
ncbi:hypothetical protein GCM10007205_04880 [Oxalicibacterium flavum]|uniref:Glycosyltransferase 2-like domain-containing protein n=1 Tax=Oxalicibacterium flavum TaxID=179467 RepID=A0A8J2UJQ7_9BURK|nr:glycosyltransferase family 2 protein [Oxalicibacterium flavum]GGB98593.1 hypothetical protein GCM10007205_04880 [Oxalicibacterium flavum]